MFFFFKLHYHVSPKLKNHSIGYILFLMSVFSFISFWLKAKKRILDPHETVKYENVLQSNLKYYEDVYDAKNMNSVCLNITINVNSEFFTIKSLFHKIVNKKD